MSNKLPSECGGNACGALPTERNRYFTGKLMTPRDFDAEQDYFLGRQRLHNRVLHGWGILCGLGVVNHPRAECQDQWIIVKTGMAMDCCGREIFLSQDKYLEVPADMPAHGLLVCIRYGEEAIEPVPALYSEGGCDPARHETNRIREIALLDFYPLCQFKLGCWLAPGNAGPCGQRHDCEEAVPGSGGTCLEPNCPCNACVPLALLTRDSGGAIHIDLGGRRHLPTPAHYLTHVTAINWPHGGEISLETLRDGLQGQLRVSFDRTLRPACGLATGISLKTFMVQYSGITRSLEFLPPSEDQEPWFDEETCTAIYPIDNNYLDSKKKHRENIGGNSVYVTLRCDFLPDCHDIPVDGNHLCGRLPSGNGVAGGDFVSWFLVTG